MFTYLIFCGILFSGGGSMFMNGEHLETLNDLKRCFCMDELIYKNPDLQTVGGDGIIEENKKGILCHVSQTKIE